MEVLEKLIVAVAAYYQAKGDMTKAGVVISHLNRGEVYVSVARYQNGPYHKKIVTKATAKTLEEAVYTVASEWYALTNPPVASAMGDLDFVLLQHAAKVTP